MEFVGSVMAIGKLNSASRALLDSISDSTIKFAVYQNYF